MSTRFRREMVPARREYTLTLVRNDGEREQYYIPHVYRTELAAQKEADERNRYCTDGRFVVVSQDCPASVAYSATLRVGKRRRNAK